MQEGIRVHPVAIRKTLARIRSRPQAIPKRQGAVQDDYGEDQERIEEFCVQAAGILDAR